MLLFVNGWSANCDQKGKTQYWLIDFQVMQDSQAIMAKKSIYIFLYDR